MRHNTAVPSCAAHRKNAACFSQGPAQQLEPQKGHWPIRLQLAEVAGAETILEMRIQRLSLSTAATASAAGWCRLDMRRSAMCEQVELQHSSGRGLFTTLNQLSRAKTQSRLCRDAASTAVIWRRLTARPLLLATAGVNCSRRRDLITAALAPSVVATASASRCRKAAADLQPTLVDGLVGNTSLQAHRSRAPFALRFVHSCDALVSAKSQVTGESRRSFRILTGG